MTHIVKLKKGREKSAMHRHPWIYSGAIDSIDGEPEPGELVTVVDQSGAFLATGYYNAASKIRVRVLEWDPLVKIDEGWWRTRIERSIAARADICEKNDTTGCRLIHAEADLLPGLIADRYGDVVVIQVLTAGVEAVRDIVVDEIKTRTGAAAVFERSDTASRVREELRASSGWIFGEAREAVTFRENGFDFTANVMTGQKTGFYCDQRDNRMAVASYAAERSVLDGFSYSGAFSVYAARAGATSLTLVDSSGAALEAAQLNLEKNRFASLDSEFVDADVFEQLRRFRKEGRKFGMVILDPPKFALNRHQVDKALRAYKDVNMLAMELLEPGGILATFSCSGAVTIDAFTISVSWAGNDANRSVQILTRLSQAADHPVLASFPESEYLKGLICRIV